jgi:hypothetical protein
MPSETLE